MVNVWQLPVTKNVRSLRNVSHALAHLQFYQLIERSVWDSPGIDYGLEFFVGKGSALHQSERSLGLRNASNCERKVRPPSDA